MAGCIDCKYHKSELGEFIDGKFGESKHKCEVGNTKDMIQWWKDNGTVKREDVGDMDCYERTTIIKNLDNILEMGNEMLKLLKDKKL